MLGLGLGIANRAVLGGAGSPSGFAAIKTKMAAGTNAKMLLIVDSTGWSKTGPFYKMAAAIGVRYPNYTVNVHRWGEWLDVDTVTGTGPKAYATADVIQTGAGSPPVLDIWLAALPGSVPAMMFDGSRRAAALDAVGTTDCIIWYHGHNIANFATIYQGRGLFIGPMGMLSEVNSGPQIIVAQSPHRDTNAMAQVFTATTDTVSAYAGGMGYIDAYTPFITLGKPANLYRAGLAGDVHPSDAAGAGNSDGAQLTSDTIMSAFAAAGSVGITTPNWIRRTTATNLATNGNLAAWTGSTPDYFLNSGGVTQTKELTNKYAGFSYSDAIQGVDASSNVQILFSTAAGPPFPPLTALQGKTLSLAVFVRCPAAADPFSVNFVANIAGVSATIQLKDLVQCRDGWMMYVAAGMPLDVTQTDFGTYIKIDPNFNNNTPPAATPQIVQLITLTESPLPQGLIP